MLKIVLIYMTVGPCVLFFSLKLFGVALRVWEPVVAYFAGVLCVIAFPSHIGEWIGCPITLIAMRYLNDAEWNDLVYSTAISRLAVLPLVMFLPAVNV